MHRLRTVARASACAIALAAWSSAARAATIVVPAGGDLHGALMNAQPGDRIVLEPGATYVGNFTLPNKNGASYITLQTLPDGLPGDGARIAPGHTLAKLRSPNGAPALQTSPGADPAIPNLVPADITIAGNAIAKQAAWRTERWSVKNLLELKNARRVSIHDNTFDYNWEAGQAGFAILFTVRDQDGGCPWCQVEQIAFEGNIVRHSAAGVSILGFDNVHPSQQARSITIRNNLFADIDRRNWGGNGYFLMLLGGARDITVDHNTVIQDEASGILTVDGPPVLGFVFTNNVARQNDYGMIGADHAPGLDTISAFLPGAHIEGNALADADPRRYPAGNRFPSSAEFRAQFVAYAAGDYRLTATSVWRGAGIDGRDLGATLEAATAPVR